MDLTSLFLVGIVLIVIGTFVHLIYRSYKSTKKN